MEGGGRACWRWLGVGRRERAPQADPASGAAGGHVESSKSVSIQAAGSRDRLTHTIGRLTHMRTRAACIPIPANPPAGPLSTRPSIASGTEPQAAGDGV